MHVDISVAYIKDNLLYTQTLNLYVLKRRCYVVYFRPEMLCDIHHFISYYSSNIQIKNYECNRPK